MEMDQEEIRSRIKTLEAYLEHTKPLPTPEKTINMGGRTLATLPRNGGKDFIDPRAPALEELAQLRTALAKANGKR